MGMVHSSMWKLFETILRGTNCLWHSIVTTANQKAVTTTPVSGQLACVSRVMIVMVIAMMITQMTLVYGTMLNVRSWKIHFNQCWTTPPIFTNARNVKTSTWMLSWKIYTTWQVKTDWPALLRGRGAWNVSRIYWAATTIKSSAIYVRRTFLSVIEISHTVTINTLTLFAATSVSQR